MAIHGADPGRLDYRQTFLLGFGFGGISLIWPIYDSFVPIFLAGYGLSASLIGFFMTFDNYINMFIQPWAGQRSDGTRSRIGRRFPYILVGAPVAAVGMALIPAGADRSLALLVGAMLVMTIAMALFRSPTVALLGDFFPPGLRAKANGVINFMGLIAAVLAFLVGGYLFDLRPSLPFLVAGGTMILVLALLLLLVREPAQPHESDESPSGPGLRPMLVALARNPERDALYILLALTAWSIGITALQAFFTLFGQSELGLTEGAASQLLSFYPLAGLIFAIPGGLLGTRFGRRNVILVALGLLTLSLLIFLRIPTGSLADASAFSLFAPATWVSTPVLALLIGLLMGAGASLTIVTVNVLPLLLNSAPGRSMGGFTGLYYFFGSIASILGPPLGGQLVDLTGSYRMIFIFAPVWTVIGMGLMWRVRDRIEPA